MGGILTWGKQHHIQQSIHIPTRGKRDFKKGPPYFTGTELVSRASAEKVAKIVLEYVLFTYTLLRF